MFMLIYYTYFYNNSTSIHQFVVIKNTIWGRNIYIYMDNALNRNIIIGLYNDIFDHRQGNKIIYYIISIFCIELKTLILLGGI